MAVIGLEVEILQSNLICPSSKDSAPHFPGVPCLRVVVQESPSLQYVDLVEPPLEYLPRFESVHSAVHVAVKLSILPLIPYKSLPSLEDAFGSDCLEVLLARSEHHLLSLSSLNEFQEASYDFFHEGLSPNSPT